MQEDQRTRYEEDLAQNIKRSNTQFEEENKRLKDKLQKEIDEQALEIKDLTEKLRECQNAKEVAEKSLQVERDQYKKKESQYSIDINQVKASLDESNEQRLILVKEIEANKEREDESKRQLKTLDDMISQQHHLMNLMKKRNQKVLMQIY